MMMSQRYPTYFDGIVSGDPAMRTGYSNIGLTWARVAFAQIAPKDASGKPDPTKDFSGGDKKLLADAIMKTCDDKDGLKDGMIFNPQACHFDPAVLTCKRAKTDSCSARSRWVRWQKRLRAARILATRSTPSMRNEHPEAIRSQLAGIGELFGQRHHSFVGKQSGQCACLYGTGPLHDQRSPLYNPFHHGERKSTPAVVPGESRARPILRRDSTTRSGVDSQLQRAAI